MSSGSPAYTADLANGGEESAAQKLLQKHAEAPHRVTVEDVPDVDGPAPPPANDGPGSSATPVSAKAAGKQQPQGARATLDTQSHELFPELGAPKGKSTNVAPIWGAKTNGKPNGSGASNNGTPLAPTPASAVATPPQAGAPSLSIPGRNVETVVLEPQYILPRGQLKRPIPDTLKDINRKSRAIITMATAPNGHLRFDATGPQEVAQQALKDLVSQIGCRV